MKMFNLHVNFRLERGPLEIQLMMNRCKEAARIKESMNLAPRILTHKVKRILG